MKVLVADPIDKAGIEALKAEVEVDVKTGLKPDELISIIGDYDGMVVRSETRVTADVIKAAKKMQVVGRAGVGLDNIDIDEATRNGVIVVNAPTSNTISAAEHSFAMMLALARHIPQANYKLKSGIWQRKDYMGTELKDKTLGVVGLGNVGSEVAKRARAFEMHIIGFDPFIAADYVKQLGIELVPLDDLLRRSDFITLHVPLTSETRNLIGPEHLNKLKPNVRIINCARGGLIDEKTLVEAIAAGIIAGAAIDVFEKEPVTESILFSQDKIVVTPHLGASTLEAQAGVALDIAEQILCVLKGKPARYTVNAPKIPIEVLQVLAPYISVASVLGSLSRQLMEGQLQGVSISYNGEIAAYDATAVKASVIGGLLEGVSEERVNIVNAAFIAAQRGIKIVEQKNTSCENYASMITVEVKTSTGSTTVAGTVLRGETHIVRINDFWPDIVPTGGYFLFSDHRDRPGMIGTVGNITGKADINISSMQLARLEKRGRALMILALDETLREDQLQEVLAIPDVQTAKMVKL